MFRKSKIINEKLQLYMAFMKIISNSEFNRHIEKEMIFIKKYNKNFSFLYKYISPIKIFFVKRNVVKILFQSTFHFIIALSLV